MPSKVTREYDLIENEETLKQLKYDINSLFNKIISLSLSKEQHYILINLEISFKALRYEPDLFRILGELSDLYISNILNTDMPYYNKGLYKSTYKYNFTNYEE